MLIDGVGLVKSIGLWLRTIHVVVVCLGTVDVSPVRAPLFKERIELASYKLYYKRIEWNWHLGSYLLFFYCIDTELSDY